MAVEEPKFRTVLKDGPFEVRDYPALTVAEVTVTGGQWSAANQGFRLLANYIFGGNARRQSIPMTAPVVQERTGQQIPMTTPVTQTPGPEGWVVRFIMPAGSTPETLPVPDDKQVHLAVLPPAARGGGAVLGLGVERSGEGADEAVARMDSIAPVGADWAGDAGPVQSAMDDLVLATERGNDPREGVSCSVTVQVLLRSAWWKACSSPACGGNPSAHAACFRAARPSLASR